MLGMHHRCHLRVRGHRRLCVNNYVIIREKTVSHSHRVCRGDRTISPTGTEKLGYGGEDFVVHTFDKCVRVFGCFSIRVQHTCQNNRFHLGDTCPLLEGCVHVVFERGTDSCFRLLLCSGIPNKLFTASELMAIYMV